MQPANKSRIAIGLVTTALGTTPFLAATGILPARTSEAADAPAWVAYAIGLAFVLAGIMIIVKGLAGAKDSSPELPRTASRGLRIFYHLLLVPIPILLATILSWVAFGPGERHFTMSPGFGAIGAAMGGGDVIGRIFFGFGAVMAWLFVGWGVLSIVRRRLPRG